MSLPLDCFLQTEKHPIVGSPFSPFTAFVTHKHPGAAGYNVLYPCVFLDPVNFVHVVWIVFLFSRVAADGFEVIL